MPHLGEKLSDSSPLRITIYCTLEIQFMINLKLSINAHFHKNFLYKAPLQYVISFGQINLPSQKPQFPLRIFEFMENLLNNNNIALDLSSGDKSNLIGTYKFGKKWSNSLHQNLAKNFVSSVA